MGQDKTIARYSNSSRLCVSCVHMGQDKTIAHLNRRNCQRQRLLSCLGWASVTLIEFTRSHTLRHTSPLPSHSPTLRYSLARGSSTDRSATMCTASMAVPGYTSRNSFSTSSCAGGRDEQ